METSIMHFCKMQKQKYVLTLQFFSTEDFLEYAFFFIVGRGFLTPIYYDDQLYIACPYPPPPLLFAYKLNPPLPFLLPCFFD